MSRHRYTAALALCVVAWSPAFATDATITVDLALERLGSEEALGTLRSIAGARSTEEVNERTVRITDVPEAVDLARTVIEMAEHPSEVAEQIPRRALADGTEIVCVHLRRASVRDVAQALRKEVRVKRLVANPALSTVMLRDAPAQISSALEVIRRMESSEE